MAVQKRVRNGKTRWIGRYRDPAGNEHSRTFDTRREAQAWISAQQVAMIRDEWVDPQGGKLTVLQVCESYMAAATKPQTADARRQLINNLGPLASVRLDQLLPSMVEAWHATLITGRPWAGGKPWAKTTAKIQLAQLTAALERAVRDGMIRKNPARGVKPQGTRGRDTAVDAREIPDAATVARFIEELQGRGQQALALAVRVMASTGMRVGEVAGMTTESLDAATRTIHVTRQAGRDGHLHPLKTEASKRVVAIDAELMAELVRWASLYAAKQGGRLFQNPRGGRMRSNGMALRLAQWATRLGFPKTLRAHALRHFHATTLLRAGVPVKTVQARLGHANASMTLEVYAHAIPADEELAVAAINAALAGGSGPGLRAVEG